MIIPETLLKIKPWGILGLKLASIILILGLIFGLGRISALSASRSSKPIEIIYPPLVKTTIPQYKESGNAIEPDTVWIFAGSKTGKTYYPKDCSGLTRIKPENRVYFTTAKEATDAGYHLSSTCK
jgi:hypothetical protein